MEIDKNFVPRRLRSLQNFISSKNDRNKELLPDLQKKFKHNIKCESGDFIIKLGKRKFRFEVSYDNEIIIREIDFIPVKLAKKIFDLIAREYK